MGVRDLDENPPAVRHDRGDVRDQFPRHHFEPDVSEFDRPLRRDLNGVSVESDDGCGGEGDPAVLGDDLLGADVKGGLASSCSVVDHVFGAVREGVGADFAAVPGIQLSVTAEALASAC